MHYLRSRQGKEWRRVCEVHTMKDCMGNRYLSFQLRGKRYVIY